MAQSSGALQLRSGAQRRAAAAQQSEGDDEDEEEEEEDDEGDEEGELHEEDRELVAAAAVTPPPLRPRLPHHHHHYHHHERRGAASRPLSASAPMRPGRVGEVIGGRAPLAQPPASARGAQGAQRSGAHGAAAQQAGVAEVAAAGRAHQGAVTAVVPTPDGLHLLTAGTDSRLRLWDATHWHRQPAGYADTFNHASRARQLAVTQDGGVVFHPTGSSVQVGLCVRVKCRAGPRRVAPCAWP